MSDPTQPTVERIELRTERLLLRPFQPIDAADAMEYRDDSEFARFLSHVPIPFTKRDSDDFVRRNMSEPWDTSPTFAIVLDHRVIGTVNLEVDHATRTAMLGYAIGRSWWGRGIATEAARATIAWGIESFGLSRVWASTDVRHAKSQRVLEKLGMIRTALQAGHHRGRAGEPIDEFKFELVLPRP